ncbi:MAG TPA: FdrA family protein, partial [Actinomycetes bacterium]
MTGDMHVEVRRGAYHDSVTLMQVSRDVAAVDGVAAAQVAMGTGLNLDLMRGMGFDPPAEAGPNDLVVAVRADDDSSLQAALARLDSALTASSAGSSDGLGGRDPEPRTVTS